MLAGGGERVGASYSVVSSLLLLLLRSKKRERKRVDRSQRGLEGGRVMEDFNVNSIGRGVIEGYCRIVWRCFRLNC